MQSVSLPNMPKFVSNVVKHIASGKQQELPTHIETFDVQVYVVLLHGSKIEHRLGDAQYLLLLSVR